MAGDTMAGDTRWVWLEGAANVRDLGGLPTEDGGTTRRGLAYRSDNLQGLTPRDVRRLVGDLGVRTIIDLRTSVEVEREGPGPLTREPVVVHRHCSLFPEGGRMTDVDADALLPWQTDEVRVADEIEHQAITAGGLDTDNPSIGYYLGYLRDRPDSAVGALRAMAEPSGGASIVHCAAGKDRTGVVVAVALAAAGVTREAIVADYVATGEVLDRILGRLRSSATYAEDLDERSADAHRPRHRTMERFLEVLDERHGGPIVWLEKAGFGADEVTALRERLSG
jgi:protein-tyrosine phosphatase